MDHDRPVRLVVGADVREVEPLRQVVVDLDGAELPLATDDVAGEKVDLRAVERGLAPLLGERRTKGGGRGPTGVLGLVPVFRPPDVLRASPRSRRPTRTLKSVMPAC